MQMGAIPPPQHLQCDGPHVLGLFDVAAGAAPSDNPWRWTVFSFNPLGVARITA